MRPLIEFLGYADVEALIQDYQRSVWGTENEIARLRHQANTPLPVERTPDYITVQVRAEASAGRGSGSLIPNELVYVATAEAGRRSLIAIRVRGECMKDAGILPGDTVLFEKVADDEVLNGDLVCITLLDENEDGAYLIKYLRWAKNGEDKVILWAADGTELTVPYDRVVIEGRYFDMRRPRK